MRHVAQRHRRALQAELVGGALGWERLDSKRACRIRFDLDQGGYKDPEEEWPAIQDSMIDAMVRLDAALRPHIDGLSL